MTPVIAQKPISEVQFAPDFTGKGKIFVKVETEGGREKMVIYEKSGLDALITDIFRNRSNTFTLREWAHRKLGHLPETFDRQQLTANIRQVASASQVEKATEILNKLISEEKLDADAMAVSKSIRFLPLGTAAFAAEIEASLKKLSDEAGLTTVQQQTEIRYKTAKKGEVIRSHFGRVSSSAYPSLDKKTYGKILDVKCTTHSEKQYFQGPINTALGNVQWLPERFRTIEFSRVLSKVTNSNTKSVSVNNPKIKDMASLLTDNGELSGKPRKEKEELKILMEVLLTQAKTADSGANTRYISTLELAIQNLDKKLDAR